MASFSPLPLPASCLFFLCISAISLADLPLV
nr:MAG TPA: hypothetical protein [Caudoviricetes sp.]